MHDVRSTLLRLLSAKMSANEAERRLMILRPLWDEEYDGCLSAPAEIATDSLIPALQSALDRNNHADVRIAVVSLSSLIAPELPFATKRAQAQHAIRFRESAYAAVRESTAENFLSLLHRSVPGGLAMLDTVLLPADLTHERHSTVLPCLESYAKPDAKQIRKALLYVYLDCSLHEKLAGVAKRIERICELASTKAVPYGIRHSDPGEAHPAFLFIAG